MRKLKQFRRNTEGSTTIEFLFWLPVIVTFVAMAVDAVMLMNQSQTMHNIARDASRSVAIGALTPAQAEAGLDTWLTSTQSSIDISEGSEGFVTTVITTPFSSIGNITSYFLNGNLSATAVMWIEGSEFNAG